MSIVLGELFLIVLVIATLAPVGIQSLCSAKAMYKKESISAQTDLQNPLIQNQDEDNRDVLTEMLNESKEGDAKEIEELQAILEREKSNASQWKVQL